MMVGQDAPAGAGRFVRTGRTLRRLALAAGGAAALLVSGCTGGGLNSVDVSSASSFAVDRGTALGSINAFRASNGLSPVAFDAVLDKAAERQARAMAARGKMSHSLDGSLPGRVSAYGYNWAAISENLGWNYGSVPAVIRGWEASPGHRRNLLNPNVTEIGLAAARGRSGEPYWALILGREKRR